MVQEPLKIVNTENEEESLVTRFKLWLRTNLGGKHPDSSLKEALEEVLEEHEEERGDELPEEEEKMIKKILNFGEIDVSDIMTPRSDIKAVEYTISFAELKMHLSQYFHTRVPVYNDTLDNIKGFIHTKDLVPILAGESEFNMAFVIRDMLFVPPSMKLIDLLVKMRAASIHIAIVVDEYGGTDGLVTLEDIFEEIVGEIQDEHDEDENRDVLTWTTEGYCDVDARIKIGRLEKELNIAFKNKEQHADYSTLGGFIFYKLGHVPTDGEVIEHDDKARFEIISADPRLIKQVRIYKAAPPEPSTPAE